MNTPAAPNSNVAKARTVAIALCTGFCRGVDHRFNAQAAGSLAEMQSLVGDQGAKRLKR